MKRAPITVVAAGLALCAVAQAKAPPKPAAPPPAATRELQILQKVMPTFDGAGVGEGGCVTVKFVIKHDGFVGDVTVLEAKPGSLAEPTVAALKQWWFQSFPPPDLTAVQTFQFAPEQVRLPDDAIRSPYVALSGDGALDNAGCGAGKPAKPGAKG